MRDMGGNTTAGRETKSLGAPAPGGNGLGIRTVSNLLSFFRLLLSVPVFIALQAEEPNRLLVLAIGLAAYISDLLDGSIARAQNKESAFGRIIDPLADKVFVTCAVIGLLAAGDIPFWYVAAVIARDILILLGGVFLRARTGVLVQSTTLGKIAVSAIAATLIAALFRRELPDVLFSVILWGSIAFLAASIVGYGERFFRILHFHKHR
ncbi:MAG: CDP-alcohol phosphatidyltransferase family protein [Bacteroidota bacterium]|nr:CDP-alcohol phosphatidyltransferase family protein [Bacteroidota bacterium]